MGYIWYSYLMNVLFPWTVKLIPGLYCPPVPVVFSLVTAEMGTAFIALITSVFVLWRNYKEGCIFFVMVYHFLPSGFQSGPYSQSNGGPFYVFAFGRIINCFSIFFTQCI